MTISGASSLLSSSCLGNRIIFFSISALNLDKGRDLIQDIYIQSYLSSCLVYATEGSPSFSSLKQHSKPLSIILIYGFCNNIDAKYFKHNSQWFLNMFCRNKYIVEWIKRTIFWKCLCSPRWCLGGAFLELCSTQKDSRRSLGFQALLWIILDGYWRV